MATVTLVICLAILDGVYSLFTGKNHGLITKCAGSHDEITFSCPTNYILYDIYLVVGVSKNGENGCKYSERDCRGTSYSLEQQRKKCQWQQTCRIAMETTARESITKAIGRRRDCVGKMASYITYGVPRCIHKDNVYDFCSRRNTMIQSSVGLLRFRNYRANRIGSHCRRQLILPENSTLQVKVDKMKKFDKIRVEMTLNGRKMKRKIKEGPAKAFRSSDGRFRFRLKRNRSVMNGGDLSLLFAVNITSTKKSSYRSYMPASLKEKENILESIANISATVQDCITPTEKSVSFSCPYGSVIYAPEIESIASNSCPSLDVKCRGLSPQLLAQRNRCYFKKSCIIKWSGMEPIAVTQNWNCLGMIGSTITAKGYQCIKEDKIYDISDPGTTIQSSWGLIRSHEDYPWNYRERKMYCKKNIMIGNGRSMFLVLDDLDLDNDRDQLTIWHVHNKSCKHNVRDIMTSSKNKVQLNGGHLQIKFVTKRRSKAGRGFILAFKIKKTGIQDADIDRISCSTDINKISRKERRKKRMFRKGLKRNFRKRKNFRRKASRKRRRSKLRLK